MIAAPTESAALWSDDLEQPASELFMLPSEVAAELGVSSRRLTRLRDAGLGPAYFTIGTAIRYLPADVAGWRLEHPRGVRIPRRRRGS